jgi:phage gpG-like protein
MAGISPGAIGAIRLRFEVEGREPAIVEMDRLRAAIEDWKPFFRDYVAPKFFRDVERNFETEGGYVGGWAPLSPIYAKWKATHYPGRPILQRKGRLFRSLQFANGNVGPGGVARITNTGAELGTSVPYGRFHQRGTGRMPPRRIVFLPTDAKQSYGRLLQQFVQDVIVARRKAAKQARPS